MKTFTDYIMEVGKMKSGKPKWKVVSNNGKVLDVFDNKNFAQMHYHVEKGWAKVVPIDED
jgi:hypothetical protein